MEWKEVDIEQTSIEIIDGDRGKNYPKNNELTNSGYCLFLSAANVTKNGLQFSNNSFITKEKDALLRKGKLMPQDIVLTTRGTVGNVGFYGDDVPYSNMRINSGMVIIRPGEDFDTMFLYLYLRSCYFRAQITQFQSGSAQPQLPISTLQKMKVIKPDIAAQRRIASILSSLDRKIELNNKINADLEEMAQAIFKNWFVDFEPFKGGKFVDSELGMIPEGWKVVVFDNILKVTTTKTGKEGIPEYSVTNTGIHPRDEKFTKNLSKSSAKNKLIRKGNLVFGMSREILNWGIMKEEIGGVSSAYNVYIVDEKIVSTTYLEYFIAQRMDYFADLIKPASREGQGVDKALLMKKIICIPPSEVLDVFLEKYNSIMHLTEIRNQENSRLSLLRDTLLPRLMSGELEVPE
ncbi:restriction endonuclease subunit S [Segatella copri]|uniref:Type I restriction modification DNA specificity domain-containing protein n=1 Tax=Segatella copri TaxID=165179 RepID=A0AA90V5L3_9BACT|nr:restriction endonuclease subunit S [Segatella copri]MQN69961.1 hypothetical protein [Segatella copri]MQN76814.1 hypothetical protein [Segatella copri]MQO00426.1 hypothetical protein [Segatella copri]